jgi:hypothetical protein
MVLDPDLILSRPDFRDRHRALKVLCLGMMIGLTMMAIFVVLVVRFALGGRPLTGNGALVGGIPIPTVIGAVVTLAVPLLAMVLARQLWTSGVQRVALEPPDVPVPGADLETDPERLWRVYASGKFVQYALAEAAILACAVLYHVNADWILIALVLSMVAYMARQFPTTAKVNSWFQIGTQAVITIRNEKLGLVQPGE